MLSVIYAECCYAAKLCVALENLTNLTVVMLSVVMLCVFMLSIVLLRVVMFNVVMLLS